MIKLSSILKEDVTKRTIMKDAIETADFFARRAFTKDEAIDLAVVAMKKLHNYVLTPEDRESIKHWIYNHPAFK